MRVGVLGINYKSSHINVREALAKTAQMHVANQMWIDKSFSFVLVSTCNRTEIYFSADDLAAAHTEIINLLRTDIGFSFEHLLYSYFGSECFSHLAKVTAGFDSVIFGETEIQGQVKRAYESACTSQNLCSSLHFIFQKALRVGKQMRFLFQLPKNLVSLEAVIHDLLQAYFYNKNPKMLFIGNSEINRLVLRYIQSKGIKDISVATRAQHLLVNFKEMRDIKVLNWDELSKWTSYDVIICGTNQKEYILNLQDTQRFCEPVSIIPTSLIIDLSMPRSVDPKLSRHPQISLFNIEEINSLVENKQRLSALEIEKMNFKINESISRQLVSYYQKNKKAESCDLLSQFC